VLEDAVASAGGPHTLSWFIKKHKSGTDHLWELTGSVASMSLDGLGRGQLPTLGLAIQAANFKHGGADGLTNPTLPAAEGHAQLSNGRNLLCSIQDYGTTAINLQDVNQISFEPGFARSKVETTTEKTHRFEGLASYSVTPGKTKFTVTLLPYADDYYADLHAGQEFRINLYMPGDGSGAGKGWCLHIPKAQLVETPSRAAVGDVQGVVLVFEAQQPSDCTGGAGRFQLLLESFVLGPETGQFAVRGVAGRRLLRCRGVVLGHGRDATPAASLYDSPRRGEVAIGRCRIRVHRIGPGRADGDTRPRSGVAVELRSMVRIRRRGRSGLRRPCGRDRPRTRPSVPLPGCGSRCPRSGRSGRRCPRSCRHG